MTGGVNIEKAVRALQSVMSILHLLSHVSYIIQVRPAQLLGAKQTTSQLYGILHPLSHQLLQVLAVPTLYHAAQHGCAAVSHAILHNDHFVCNMSMPTCNIELQLLAYSQPCSYIGILTYTTHMSAVELVIVCY